MCKRFLLLYQEKTRDGSGSRKEKRKKKRKKKEKGKNTCRTIEDGIGSAFDSIDVSYPRRC